MPAFCQAAATLIHPQNLSVESAHTAGGLNARRCLPDHLRGYKKIERLSAAPLRLLQSQANNLAAPSYASEPTITFRREGTR